MTEWPARVEIREVGPRDGLQNEAPVPVADRIRLIDALSRTGLRRIEAAAFVSAKAIPPMAGSDEVMAQIDRVDGVTYSALVPNAKGAELAIAARADELELVVSASETHNEKNVRRSVAESLVGARDVVELAHGAGIEAEAIVSTSFGCPYAPGASGNAVTEDLVHMCADMNIETGIDLDALLGCAEMAQEIVGRELPSALLHAGPRARRHGS